MEDTKIYLARCFCSISNKAESRFFNKEDAINFCWDYYCDVVCDDDDDFMTTYASKCVDDYELLRSKLYIPGVCKISEAPVHSSYQVSYRPPYEW